MRLACLHAVCLFVFQMHFCSSWPVCEPLSAMSHVNSEADGAKAVILSSDVSPTRCPIFTQVSRLHPEEADREPEGAVLCGGALLQGVHRSESEECRADGGG